ncbi:MAG: thioredoxin family protein [Sulfurovaceae bacterium]|nr:thioredoxin family protein [Sulfurovaceae bacterium]
MKKLIFIFSILCSMANAANLKWNDDFNEAILKAKKEHKALMVMVESEHCRWCKAMNETTFNDNKVKAGLRSFVLIKIMRDDTESMRLLPDVVGVPTVFFMTPEKEILEQAIGFFEEEDFLIFINNAKKKFYTKNKQ